MINRWDADFYWWTREAATGPLSITSGLTIENEITMNFNTNRVILRLSKAGTESEMTEIFTGDILR